MAPTAIVPLSAFRTHSTDRFVLNIKSKLNHEIKIVLFQAENIDTNEGSDNRFSYYCVEAACPHSGGPLEEGEIEDLGDGQFAIICPWHDYLFNLSTGECEEGFTTCTYKTSVHDGMIFIEIDGELISIDNYDCPLPFHSLSTGKPKIDISVSDVSGCELSVALSKLSIPSEQEHQQNILVPNGPFVMALPSTLSTLTELAVQILNTADPLAKAELTIHIGQQHLNNPFPIGSCCPPDVPPRPAGVKLIEPGKDIKRGKGGSIVSRIKILHSLANIEIVAIDLAWDIIARFSDYKVNGTESLPLEFFNDFVKVAMDEAKHFTLLRNRLQELGSYFGAYPVHNALWESAIQTSKSLSARLAIVHMIHEARGLDVNPATITKFEKANDSKSVEVLTTIHEDEIFHVAYGHKWFEYLAEQEHSSENKYQWFHRTARLYFRGPLKPPFNEADRLKAGLDREWYYPLSGEAWVVDS